MLIDYIDAAMQLATYELLPDKEGYVGTIRRCRGLIGHGRTLESCREDLHGAVQSWLLVKLRHGDKDLPIINKINLTSVKSPSKARKKNSSQRAA